jgi:hypothetical protein
MVKPSSAPIAYSAAFKAGTECSNFVNSGMQEPQLVPAFSLAPIWAIVVRPSAWMAARIFSSLTAKQEQMVLTGFSPRMLLPAKARKIRAGRPEEDTGRELAMQDAGIAEHGLSRIGIGYQFGVGGNPQQAPKHAFGMHFALQRMPARQFEGKTGIGLRLGPPQKFAELWLSAG